VPSQLDGVSCSYATMGAGETPDTPNPEVGECHTTVPDAGLTFSVRAGQTERLSLISARFSNMDAGVTTAASAARMAAAAAATATTTSTGPLEAAKTAWIAANASAGTLFASHTAALATLNTPGIEVEGNLEFARIVNASMFALLVRTMSLFTFNLHNTDHFAKTGSGQT
jgi:hypothetical protein